MVQYDKTNEKARKVNIRFDADGYATFECPCCLDSFQLRAEECNLDDMFEVWCPSCGLKKVINRFIGRMTQELRQISTSSRNSIIAIEIKTNFGKEYENLLFPDVAAFEEVVCRSCERPYRVHPLTLFMGPYCPFCGESI